MKKLSNNQRFYYFYQVLEKYSGEENSLTAEEISEHMKTIMEYGALKTPALVINEELKLMGKIPSVEEIKELLK